MTFFLTSGGVCGRRGEERVKVPISTANIDPSSVHTQYISHRKSDEKKIYSVYLYIWFISPLKVGSQGKAFRVQGNYILPFPSMPCLYIGGGASLTLCFFPYHHFLILHPPSQCNNVTTGHFHQTLSNMSVIHYHYIRKLSYILQTHKYHFH